LFFIDDPVEELIYQEAMIEDYIHNTYNGLRMVLNDENLGSITFLITTTAPWHILATLCSAASLNSPRISCRFDRRGVSDRPLWFSEAYDQTSRTLYIATHYLLQRIRIETPNLTPEYMHQMFEDIKSKEEDVTRNILGTYKTWRGNR